jgi:nucleoside-diphosphate-sugar epimerase
MKTALVMGISGGFGSSVAQALVERGWAVRALMRDPARLPAQLRNVEVMTGDAKDIRAVRKAAHGVDLMVYAVNPPRYDWNGVARPMLETTAQVAEENGSTVLFPGNVYVFDPADGPDFDEQALRRPVTSKGRIRQAMETRLEQASRRGARVIVLRMGDYIGENAPSAWLGVLLKRTRHGFSLFTPGPRDLTHTWAYLPDAARAAAQLAAMHDELPRWSVFHFRGYRMSLRDIADTLQQVSGKRVRLKAFPWWAMRIVAPFSVLFRGLLEMRYLWRRQVNLDDAKLQRTLGKPVPHTPLPVALAELGLGAHPPTSSVTPERGRPTAP